MDPITCGYCGSRVGVTASDLPLSFRQDPAAGPRKPQFVIVGSGLLLHQCVIPGDDGVMVDPLTYSKAVHQAQGMVATQAGCSMSHALALMMNTADTTDTSMDEVAEEIRAHRVTYDAPS